MARGHGCSGSGERVRVRVGKMALARWRRAGEGVYEGCLRQQVQYGMGSMVQGGRGCMLGPAQDGGLEMAVARGQDR